MQGFLLLSSLFAFLNAQFDSSSNKDVTELASDNHNCPEFIVINQYEIEQNSDDGIVILYQIEGIEFPVSKLIRIFENVELKSLSKEEDGVMVLRGFEINPIIGENMCVNGNQIENVE